MRREELPHFTVAWHLVDQSSQLLVHLSCCTTKGLVLLHAIEAPSSPEVG